MPRNPRYDVLFEPVRIGPVTTRNRFYCTPHAVGTGQQMPHTRAALREVRAEGGWGVVNTGYCSIHPSSDDAPLPYSRLWDDEDVKVHELMVDAVHKHGSLAGVELWHGGGGTANKMSRRPLLSASGVTDDITYPGWINLAQSRPMDKQDIAEFRRWHVAAAKRARSAGFDIIYTYAGMNFGPYQFLLPWLNKRTDEYGGSLENRLRLTREILEEMKAAVGDECAIALRFSTEDLLQVPSDNMESEAHEVVTLLADLPDLWDVKSSSWTRETVSARFSEQGAQEPINSFVKALTDRPVVGVGRFTSPDMMVSQINRGILDLIGAARPSIADPFLPNKINEGREDEIRECIGCNICVSGYHDGVPVRCTQNPTMGEEWRRKWHPERLPAGNRSTSVLIVGAGPAGLECARAMGIRGFAVTLAEARNELGGRVNLESRLPGLSTWARVRDYRTNLLQSMPNVDIYPDNELAANDIAEFDTDHVVIATGAHWSATILDNRGHPSQQLPADGIFTPDDILSGTELQGPVVIYDFDHYYMGSCLAELLRQRGLDVTIATTASAVSAWTFMNNEMVDIRKRMIELGIRTVLESRLSGFASGSARFESIYPGGPAVAIDCVSLVIVGKRLANDALYQQLRASGMQNIRCIGDSLVPGAIAHAVYSGHECARTIDDPAGADGAENFSWERPQLTKS